MKKILNRIFIEGLSGMAYGLFATLIIGTIIQQIGNLIGGNWGTLIYQFGKFAAAMTGAGIGAGVACRFKEGPLVVLSAITAGMVGAFAGNISSGAVFTEEGALLLSGPGEPLGAFIAAYVAIELSRLIAGKTKLDIILAPLAGILGGAFVGILVGPPISRLMTQLGAMINWGTEQQPFLMGIVVSVLMGMILTLPISSAALGVILNLSGLAAGAATIGCCCNMVGFAVASYRENGLSGLLAQGIGTSMLQVPNIMRHPLIWLPAIIFNGIFLTHEKHPAVTVLAGMTNNATGSGMGTAGFVGQIMTWQTMTVSEDPVIVLIKIVLLHFVLPGILSLIISEKMRKMGLIKPGHMKLDM